MAVVEQPDVVGDGTRGVDVVGHDQERRAGLLVEVDDQLVEVGRPHRVEAGVGLVEEHDLGFEHQRSGESRALAHAAGDLSRELALGALQPDQLEHVHHDGADLTLGPSGVFAQWERDVVVEVHRPEKRAVLEENAEEAADVVQLPLATRRDIVTLDKI